MKKDIDFSVIVPAFNEEEAIEGFLATLKQAIRDTGLKNEIIVIDDGSTDGTHSILAGIPDIEIIRHPYNKGNGASVKAGIQASHGERIVVIDSDGQHDPKHIPEMLSLLETYDLVVGARESFGLGKRGLGNYLISRLASYLSGVDIPDLTCGFRAFKKERMSEFIDLLPNRYSLPSTSTLAFATSANNIKFIPINSLTRESGKSDIHILKDGLKFLVLVLRIVSLFRPLKVFTPVSLFLLLFGSLWSVRSFTISRGISSLGAMLLLAGIFILLFGLLADQLAETRLSIGKISKRLKNADREEDD